MGLIKGTVTAENFEKICKVCLEEKSPTFNLNSRIQFQFPCTLSIGDILNKITSETGNKEESQVEIICNDCLLELRTAYTLVVKYQESKRILQEFLGTYVKTEIIESENEEIVAVKVGNDFESHDEPIIIDNKSELVQNKLLQLLTNLSQKKNHHETIFDNKLQLLQNEAMVVNNNPTLELNQSKKKGDVEEKKIGCTRRSTLHTCPVCNQDFAALELREHVHSHKAFKKYLNIPDQSKVKPTTKFSTRRHMTTPQTSFFKRPEKIYKCPYCNLEFSVENFAVHFDSHRIHGDYKCEKCGREFNRVNHLNMHRIKHLKEFPYKCEHCGKGFILKRNFDCHVLTHSGIELPHQCSFCLKRFSNPQHLHRHLLIHTENVNYHSKYRVLKCNRCLRTFADKSRMNSHFCVAIEKAVKGKHLCKFCMNVFGSYGALKYHQQKIHKMRPRKVLCAICGACVSHLPTHMLQHTGEKRFQCNQCGKKFTFKQGLQHHLLQHTGEKPYQCEQCGKRFTNQSRLKIHFLIHSGLKPFVCLVCGKDFNNPYNLQVHERIHVGNKCHVCSVCDKGFLEKSYLKKHMRVHLKTEVKEEGAN